MTDPMEDMLRETLLRARADAPAVPDPEALLVGARALRRRRNAAALVAVAAAVAAAIVVPVLLSQDGSLGRTPPVGTPSPSPSGPTKKLTDTGYMTRSGRWNTAPTSALTASTPRYAFGLSSGADSSKPPTVERFGDDGVHTLTVDPHATGYTGPALLTSSTSAVYAATQAPARLIIGTRDRIWRIEPATMRVTATATLPAMPWTVTATDRGVVVGTATTLYLLDPTSLQVRAKYTKLGASPHDGQAFFSVTATSFGVDALYGDATSQQWLHLDNDLRLVTQQPLAETGQGAHLYSSDCGTWLLTGSGQIHNISGSLIGPALTAPAPLPTAAAASCDGLDLITAAASGPTLVHHDQDGAATATVGPLDSATGDQLAFNATDETLWTGGSVIERFRVNFAPPPPIETPKITAPPCALSNLGVTYRGGGGGTGNEFGSLVLRNLAATPCTIRSALTITALDSAGQPIRLRRELRSTPAQPPLVLTAGAPRIPPGFEPPAGVVEAAVILAGEYRDGPGANGMCPARDEVTPSSWRVTLGGAHVDVANNDPAGQNPQLRACLGNFSVNPQMPA